MSIGKVYVKLVYLWLAFLFRILEIFRDFGALSPTTTTRWHTTVGVIVVIIL